ncbi:hypothetical protein COCVIDRAFT_106798 [Bipolaris victoriae FI3]|uniref:Uncharacterized protein n=2 Tax=Bipolaris TaxID=33194 RepID=W6Y2X0_COCC2|nr:uncharacterized protein COCCADRAFT_37993 [Bipolaris zeicola 26-R-13]XP_014553724.1 hypothetical protein COCVIDRAFT_106798 [Bipolaris victoriae FI3]EUC31970.1 hypothetical protein COCCADRAFT_37993 [Bipolaris zeicola 26-R-13]
MPLTWSMRTVHLSSFSTCSPPLDQAAMYLHSEIIPTRSPTSPASNPPPAPVAQDGTLQIMSPAAHLHLHHHHHTPRSLPASLHLNVLDPIPPSVSRGSVPSASSCNTHSPRPHPRQLPHRGRALSSAFFPSHSGP